VSRDTWAAATSLTGTDAVADWAEEQADAGLTGITMSGGEPLDQTEQLVALLTDLRGRPRLTDKDRLLYTGYAYSTVSGRHAAVLPLVDAIISGPYVASKPSDHPWIGSANQVLTLLTGRARDRFTKPAGPRQLQISADGGRIWMTGIPGRGDLERLQSLLAERGVLLGDVSWRL
jgi:anaerobic ribonucleoside-triphosphate reductase activating protein